MSSLSHHHARRPLTAVGAILVGVALLLTGLSPAAADPTSTLVRIDGKNRWETAAKIAASYHSSGADTVYIALGGDFPDALAGAPAAAADDAPILLVQSTSVPSATRQQLSALAPSRIKVLGGPSSISSSVITELRGLVPGVSVTRLAGSNRYATSARISAATFSPGVDVTYIATGQGYADALAGAAAAGQDRAPILLVRHDRVPSEVAAELLRLQPKRIVVLGSTTAVSGKVATALSEFTSGSVKRLQGANRFETAAAISKAAFPQGARTVFVATGVDFPDALAAGPAAVLDDAPILLVRRDVLPTAVRTELIRLNPDVVVILGGTASISNAVANQLADPTSNGPSPEALAALAMLAEIEVRTYQAPGYKREEFGSGWSTINGCNTRNRVLIRDLTSVQMDGEGRCHVLSGILSDPYTGTTIAFTRERPNEVQIDHVVAVSSAWKMGANEWTRQERIAWYNDMANLLAVDGPTNSAKGEKTLGEWQPPNEAYRCDFAFTYIEVTFLYDLAIKPVDAGYAEELLPTC